MSGTKFEINNSLDPNSACVKALSQVLLEVCCHKSDTTPVCILTCFERKGVWVFCWGLILFCCLLSRGGAVGLVCVVGQARWELVSCPSAAHIVASGSNCMQNKPLNRASSHAKLIELVFTDRWRVRLVVRNNFAYCLLCLLTAIRNRCKGGLLKKLIYQTNRFSFIFRNLIFFKSAPETSLPLKNEAVHKEHSPFMTVTGHKKRYFCRKWGAI